MKLLINDIEADGIEGDVVMTLSANDLSDIVTKNGGYSNTFELAITNTNRKIFDSAEVVISNANNVYKKLPAKIVVDGLEAVSGFAILKQAKKTYSVSVFTGNSNFFQLIKEFKLEQIKSYLDALDHPATETEVINRRNNGTTLIYPNIDYGYFEKYDGLPASPAFSDTPYNFFFYCVYSKYILQSVFDVLGYGTTGDFWSGDVYQNLALPFNRVRSKQVFELSAETTWVKGELQGTPGNTKTCWFSFKSITEDTGSNYNFITIPGLGSRRAYKFNEAPSNNTITLILNGIFRYTQGVYYDKDANAFHGEINIGLKIFNFNTGTAGGYVFLNTYSNFNIGFGFTNIVQECIIDVNTSTLSNLGTFDYTQHCLVWEITVQYGHTLDSSPWNPGDPITDGITNSIGTYKPSPVNLYTTQNITWSFTNKLATSDLQNLVYESAPKFKISDLFKSVFNIEGAFVIVDEDIKKIRSVYLDDIKKNIANAYDWSDKLDLSEEPEITYRFGSYGQKNVFKYKHDESDIYIQKQPTLGEGYLDIADETLATNKDIVEIPFGLCAIEQTTTSPSISMAKVYTSDKYTYNVNTDKFELTDPDFANSENIKPRIVKLVNSTNTLIQINETGGSTREVSNSISFSNVVPQRYGLIKDITTRTKIVNCLFRLKVNDIYNFDFSRPVYVAYFGEYFFVNKIEQFKFNRVESTKCELIRI